MAMQDSWLFQLAERISRCEEMAGISSDSTSLPAVPMPVITSLETPQLIRPRSLSDHSISSTCTQSVKSESGRSSRRPRSATSSIDDDSSATGGKKRKSTHRPCTYPGGCEKLAHGPDYKFCLRHGGGYRCQVDGCSRSAYSTRYCSRHGGGPRCQFPSCVKGAISNSSFCRRHGGGPRCQHPNCTEGARIGYAHCLSHGGYNPCAFPSCPCPSLHTSSYCRQHNSYNRKVDTTNLPTFGLPNLTN